MAREPGERRAARVLVTADDAGSRPDWDQEILRAVDAGAVDCVSLLANGRTAHRMAAELQARPRVLVAAHLNLVDGEPLAGRGALSTLLDGSGRFSPSPWYVLARRSLGLLDLRQVETEWAAQIDRVRKLGLTPSFINGHYHLHLLPGLSDIAARLARRFQVPAMRLIGDRIRAVPGISTGLLKVCALRAASVDASRALARAGVGALSAHGNAHPGRLDEDRWSAVVGDLPSGRVEIVCHPGQDPLKRWSAVPESLERGRAERWTR